MNIWNKALKMADATPDSRNRYVDFLRGLSILAVVFGHWLIAAPHFDHGQPKLSHILEVSSWTQWLTWLFQVMPVFFFVGGFSNRTSWLSALRDGKGYSQWLNSRLKRLIGPVLPLLLVWTAMAIPAHHLGVSNGMIKTGSQVALVPVWFLAVYILVILMVPWTHALWERFRLGSIAIFIVLAVLVDVAFFTKAMPILGWLNYFFVWLAVHQAGYAWRDGLLSRPGLMLAVAFGGLASLLILVFLGPYPLSMVGVPGDNISNTLPPKISLLALGAIQIGFFLFLEKPARRWLSGRTLWAIVVLINGMIMTVFLWHSTVMILIMGFSFWQLPHFLTTLPASGTWWLLRPVWMLVYALFCVPFIITFARFENPGIKGSVGPVAVWRLFLGCVLGGLGLALLALSGIGADNALGIRVLPILLPFIGADIAGFGIICSLYRAATKNSA